MYRLSDKNIGILGTVLFHSLIILVLGAIGIDYSKKLPEYVEMVISSGLLRVENEDVSKNFPEKSTETITPMNKVDVSKLNRVIARDNNSPIDIPDKISNLRELEVQKTEKKDNKDDINPIKSADKDAESGKVTDIESQMKYKGNDAKIESDFDEKGETRKYLPLSRIGTGNSELKSFSIEWFGAERERISGKLPEFPEGVKKEGVVKIKFFVKPDGTVGEIIPVLKADSKLENASLNALKNWRFSSLGNEAPQVDQQGVITFIFKLK